MPLLLNGSVNILLLALITIRLTLISLWRETRTAIIIRVLLVISIYALTAFLIISNNLNTSSWIVEVTILGIAAMATSGLSLRFRKRRELMLPWMMSMPVRISIWAQFDAIALTIIASALTVPFLFFLWAMNNLTLCSVTVLFIAQAFLVLILAKFCASSKPGEFGWTVAIVIIWVLITIQFDHHL